MINFLINLKPKMIIFILNSRMLHIFPSFLFKCFIITMSSLRIFLYNFAYLIQIFLK